MAAAELSPPQLPKHSQAFIIVLEMNETMELKKSRRSAGGGGGGIILILIQDLL